METERTGWGEEVGGGGGGGGGMDRHRCSGGLFCDGVDPSLNWAAAQLKS